MEVFGLGAMGQFGYVNKTAYDTLLLEVDAYKVRIKELEERILSLELDLAYANVEIEGLRGK